jgi:hypothetical protein
MSGFNEGDAPSTAKEDSCQCQKEDAQKGAHIQTSTGTAFCLSNQGLAAGRNKKKKMMNVSMSDSKMNGEKRMVNRLTPIPMREIAA